MNNNLMKIAKKLLISPKKSAKKIDNAYFWYYNIYET